MRKDFRFTLQAFRVMGVLCKSPGKEFSGSAISARTNLRSGTIYPLLGRLEKAGFLKARWEGGHPRELKRPLRKYYRARAAGRKHFHFESSRNP